VGKLLKRGAPKMRTKLGKDGKPLKDKRGNLINEVVRKNGKIVYEPYEIKVLNTIDFKKSMHYNPFAYIKSEKDILKFVTALISNTKGEDTKGGEDFWVKAETLLYCALVGLIHYESAEDERNMNTLVELINSMEVHEEDESFQNPVDIIFERLEKGMPELSESGELVVDTSGKAVFIRPPQPDHFAVRQYKKYRLAAGLIQSNGLPNQESIIYSGQDACGTGERTPQHGEQPRKEKLMELEYVQAGDYLLPNLILSERAGEHPPIGRYGKMRRAFLKEHRPIQYSRLVLSEQLFPHLRTVDEIANERRKNGCPESVIISEIVCEI
jgi:hypothetical protein